MLAGAGAGEHPRSMKRILITGGAGQVGSDLIKLFHANDAEVSVFDLVPAPEDLPAGVDWRRGDITDASELDEYVKQRRPDIIFHLAALLSAIGEKMPHRCYRVNMNGTHNVLEAARLFDVPQVMYASTIAVFGPGLPDPVQDDVPLQPTTMYGVTKVAGELLGAYYKQRWDVDFRGVRFPGLINAGIPGGGTTDYALFMYVDGIRYGHYECFVGPQSKVPMMYMPDALRAMVELSEADGDKLSRSIYNIAAMSPTAEEFAGAVRKRVPDVELTFRVDPKRQAILESWPCVLDDSAARRDWNWNHEYDLETMSDDLVPKIRAMVGK